MELHTEVDENPDAKVTVVLCHGCTLDLDSWRFQRASLREHARVVVWDQRGHGRSGSGGPKCPELLGRDLHAVLRETTPTGPVILIGHSMGGVGILALARQYPELFGDRVIGVGLLATPASQITSTLSSCGAAGSALPAGFQSALRQPLEVPEVIAELYPHLREYDHGRALPVLQQVETLVMVGESDLITPLTDSQAIVSAVPESELVVVPNAGHGLVFENPQLVNSHLEDFVLRFR